MKIKKILNTFFISIFMFFALSITTISYADNSVNNIDSTGFSQQNQQTPPQKQQLKSTQNLVLFLNKNPDKKNYLLKFKDDVKKKYNIVIDENNLTNDTILLLYDRAYNYMVDRSDYMMLPQILADQNGISKKAYYLYEIDKGEEYKNSIGKQILSNDKATKTLFQKLFKDDPLDAPVAVIMTDLVNVFGERVAFLDAKTPGINAEYNIFNNEKSPTYQIVLPNGLQTGITLNPDYEISMDYEKFQRDYSFCWTCTLVDYSIDAVDYFVFVTQKVLMPYIIALLFIGFMLYILYNFYTGIILKEGSDPAAYVKSVLKRVFVIGIALFLISNINTSFFYLFARPVILTATATGNFIAQNNEAHPEQCAYTRNKAQRIEQKNKFFPSTSASNSTNYNANKNSFFHDTSDGNVDLKNELICSVYSLVEKNNEMIVIAQVLWKYSSLNIIIYLGLILMSIIMSLSIGLFLVDSIFNMALALFFAPFAIVAWALSDESGKILYLNLRISLIFTSFMNAAIKIVSLFIGVSVFIVIITTFFTDTAVDFKTMLTSSKYSAAILVNLLEYNKNIDFIAMIILMYLSTSLIAKSQSIVNDLSISLFGIGGGEEGDIGTVSLLTGFTNNIKDKYKQKAKTAATKTSTTFLNKFKKK